MCGSLAKFTRNLVAGIPQNQSRAMCVSFWNPGPYSIQHLLSRENEPDIRRLIHYHTSWTAMEDEQCVFNHRMPELCANLFLPAIAIARTLAQALSNIVTSNESLTSSLWNIYMNLPEDQVILMYDNVLHHLRSVSSNRLGTSAVGYSPPQILAPY